MQQKLQLILILCSCRMIHQQKLAYNTSLDIAQSTSDAQFLEVV